MGQQSSSRATWFWRAKQALRQRGSAVVHLIHRHTGYNADQLSNGLQVAAGLLLMLGCFGWPAAWRALSLQSAAITPVYAIVTFCVVLQPNQGTASQFVLMRAAGAVVGGAAGLLCGYLTWWANGSSYRPSATKGAVMVTLLSLLSFQFSLLRFRFPRFWFAFTVATFSMPMVALNPFRLDYVEHQALFYWWLQIALGTLAAALCSTLVFPVTAGHKVRLKTAEAMRGLGGLTAAAVAYMARLPLGDDGLAAGLTGTLDDRNATDLGLAAAFQPLYDRAIQASTTLSQARALLAVVGTEWSVYSQAHVFPREAFELLLYINRAYLSSLMALLYPLQSGRLALRAVQSAGPEFQAAADLLASCLTAAADCIERGAPYADALAALRKLEARWRSLHGLCPELHSSWGENEVLTSDMLVGTLFSLGTRARRVCFTLPEALHTSQPGARQQAFRHFRRSSVWDLGASQEQLRQRARLRATTPRVADLDSLPSPRSHSLAAAATPRPPPPSNAKPVSLATSPAAAQHLASPGRPASGSGALRFFSWRALSPNSLFSSSSVPQPEPQVALAAADGGGGGGDSGAETPQATWHQMPSSAGARGEHALQAEALWQPPDAAQLAERFPQTIYLPDPPPQGRLARAAAAVHQRTGLTSEHAALALQMAVAMAAACTLHVVEASYRALHEKTIWVVVTVAVILESAVGGLVLKSGLRILATCTAGLLGVGLIGLAVLCNGGTYLNQPAKFASMGAFLPAAGFLLMVNHVRFAQPYGYFWSCTKFTLPIIALSGYISPTVQWTTAVWRLINILLGIALDLAACSLILPVSSRQATRRRVQEVLAGLADLSETVLLEFVEGSTEGGAPPPPAAAAQTPAPPGLMAAPGRASPTPTRQLSGLSVESTALWAGGGGGSGGGSGGSTPTARRRRPRVPRTPLSQSEAYELATEAQAAASQEQRERRLMAALQWRSSGGAPAALESEPSLPASPGRRLLNAVGALTPRFLRRAWSDTAQRGAPPLPFSADSDKSLGAAAAGATADLELAAVKVEAPPETPQPGAAGGTATPPAAAAGTPPSAAAEAAAGSPPRMPHLELPPGQLPLPGAGGARAPPRPSPFVSQGSPERVSPRSTSQPGRGRRGASQPPDLPTVVSQQALMDSELPVLPPLHIPLTHQQTIAEDGQSTATGGAGSPRSPLALASPFGDLASQQAGGGGGGERRSSGEGEPGSAAFTRRPSASSTIFYAGTPKGAAARTRRSRWLQERALGRSFVKVRRLGAELAATIGHMHELALFARFEWVPWQRPHRTAPADVLAAQHACRKLLNVLLTFAYLADSPDIKHTRLLMPWPREVRAVAAQMGEALHALSLVVDGQLGVERALEMVFNLQLQVQLLLLEVEQAAPGPDSSPADSVLGVAALGIMFSATQTTQLLFRCVLRLLGSPDQAAAAEAAFARSAAWGASVEAILVARGVVLSSFGATDSDEVAAAAAEGAGDAEAAAGLGMRGD